MFNREVLSSVLFFVTMKDVRYSANVFEESPLKNESIESFAYCGIVTDGSQKKKN